MRDYHSYDCLVGVVFGEIEGIPAQCDEVGGKVQLCRAVDALNKDIEALADIDNAHYVAARVRARLLCLLGDAEVRAAFAELVVSVLRARVLSSTIP